MTAARDGHVWVRGPKLEEIYLFDTSTGRPRRYVANWLKTGAAGNGSYFGRQFAAVYVDIDGQIVLQTGSTKLPITSETRAEYRRRLGGLYCSIWVSNPGSPTFYLRQRTLARFWWQLTDSSYDGTEEVMEDKVASLARLIANEEAQRLFTVYNCHDSGPWHLVES